MMVEEEIIEGNKLIVVFMGLHTDAVKYIETTMIFHTSWDWLMPVVEKIEKLGLGYFKYHYTWSYYNSNGNCLWYKNNNEKGIMNLFFEVVEFIKWYNENKTK